MYSVKGLITLLNTIGLKPNTARIMAVLVTSNKALTLREICEATGYTKSRASELMKLLEVSGLIEVTIVKKRAYYKAKIDELVKRVERHLEKLVEALEAAHHESGIRDFMEIASNIKVSRKGGGFIDK